MKNIKKKMLVAGLFSALMLLMPINTLAHEEAVENLDLQLQQEELEFVAYNTQSPIIDYLELIGKYSLKLIVYELIGEYGLEAIETGEVVLSEEAVNAVVESIFEYESLILDQGMEITGVGDVGFDNNEVLSNYYEDAAQYNEENMEAGYLNSDLAETIYLESEEDIYSYILGDIFDIDEYAIPRLGYLCGIVEFMQLKSDLKDYIWENITPPVTYIDIIEETAAWFGLTVDVEYFIYNTLNATLQDLAENRPWIIEGLGIRRNIYETYILPLILSYGIPFLLDSIHANLNATVLDLKVEWKKRQSQR